MASEAMLLRHPDGGAGMPPSARDAPLRTLLLDADQAQRTLLGRVLEEDGRFVVVGAFSPGACS